MLRCNISLRCGKMCRNIMIGGWISNDCTFRKQKARKTGWQALRR